MVGTTGAIRARAGFPLVDMHDLADPVDAALDTAIAEIDAEVNRDLDPFRPGDWPA